MFFTTGKHMFYEHLMQQVPNFGKAPRDIKLCLSGRATASGF